MFLHIEHQTSYYFTSERVKGQAFESRKSIFGFSSREVRQDSQGPQSRNPQPFTNPDRFR